MCQEGSSRPAAFPFEVGPTIIGAAYDDGDGTITVTGSEDLDLDSGVATPWTVTFDGAPQAVTDVDTVGTQILLTTTAGGASTEILLSYSGGNYVVSVATGLALQAVSDFPVGVI